jgi:hypothetical protein
MPITINGSGSIAGISVGGLENGCVNEADLATAAVSNAKLAAAAVSPDKLSTGAPTWDSSGNVGIGRAPTFELDVYKSSGNATVQVDSDSLANGEQAWFRAVGGARGAELGVTKHSGITNPCAFLRLDTENAAINYTWVDNSNNLRISTTISHIGTTSGTVVGTQTSDERIKNILGPVTYGLDEIKQLDPVSYALKSDPDQIPHLGFIAQQVLPLVPESVFDTDEVIEEGEPTKLGMEYVALIPVLVNAIKELSAQNEALETRLAALEVTP